MPTPKDQLDKAYENLPETAEEELLGEQLDLTKIYHVKGRPGLYVLSAYKERSQFVAVSRLDEREKVTHVKIDLLNRLDQYDFHTTTPLEIKYDKATNKILDPNGDHSGIDVGIHKTHVKLKLSDVFSNIGHLDPEVLEKKSDAELMELMVPDYDPSLFKPYHAKKVLKWYRLVLDYMDRMTQQPVAESEKE